MTRRANRPSAIASRTVESAVLQFAVASVWGRVDAPVGFELDTDFVVQTLPIRPDDLLSLFETTLSNAVVHHDCPTARIVVASATDGAFTCVTISDDGPGIAPQRHAEVFEDETQGDKAPDRGLPSVQRIVDRYEGHVDIAPTDKARGTTVRIWIPSDPA